MKEIIKLVLVMTVVSTVCGLLLAYTNGITSQPIKDAKAAEKTLALKSVLPEFDNDPGKNTNYVATAGLTFHVGRLKGEFSGAAVEATSPKGYGGAIAVMIGFTPDGRINAIKITQQNETPGLGSKIKDPGFLGQFPGKDAGKTTWRVKKDGGNIDSITGATISSRAVCEAVDRAAAAFLQNRDSIMATGKQGE